MRVSVLVSANRCPIFLGYYVVDKLSFLGRGLSVMYKSCRVFQMYDVRTMFFDS